MSERLHEDRKQYHQIEPEDYPDVVVVPASVIIDPDVSPNDLGLYVRAMHEMSLYYGPHDLDETVTRMTGGRMGQRIDGNEAAVRAGLQRLVDAGHLKVTFPARAPKPR
ncbi:hypothetical protein QWJ26_24255 [Streptomyces sp. CSDS2]|uniref:hypothetical protein n=1 Tax=Streptomyces sp. CSDS2 TaxID=3055051 RepID=UPI0025AEE6DF|nr:hypothetical protein [Streptomyces sp. CSDS2]MDN3262861.1 hypothetical protein [Streptomyces sp. CSDS2]